MHYVDPSVVMSKTHRLAILREYKASRSTETTAPDMNAEDHVLKVMKLAVEEYASYYKSQIKEHDAKSTKANEGAD